MRSNPTSPSAADARVRESFARQRLMATLGVSLHSVVAGEVQLEVPFRDDLTQQHGFIHAGVVTAVLDSACGFAALTTMSAESAVVSAGFSVNLLSPAIGERFVATGRVVKGGRTLVVCDGELRAFASDDAEGKVVAIMRGTMMTVMGRAGMSG